MHKATWALILGALLIGFAPVLAKKAVDADPALIPTSVAFLRLGLAIPFFLLMGGRWRHWQDGIPGLFFALDLGLWHWAFEHTSVANATLEANLAVVIAAIVGFIYFKESVSRSFVWGVGLAVVGMAGLLGISMQQGQIFGDLLGLATAFAYTAYMIAIKIRRPNTDLISLMLGTVTAGALVLAIATALQGGSLVPSNGAGWGFSLALTLTSQLCGQMLIAYGLGRVPIGLAAALLLLQPLVAAILGWLWLNQHLTGWQILSGLLALAGIYLAQRRPSQANVATKESQPRTF